MTNCLIIQTRHWRTKFMGVLTYYSPVKSSYLCFHFLYNSSFSQLEKRFGLLAHPSSSLDTYTATVGPPILPAHENPTTVIIFLKDNARFSPIPSVNHIHTGLIRGITFSTYLIYVVANCTVS